MVIRRNPRCVFKKWMLSFIDLLLYGASLYFFIKRKISLRARNRDSEPIKVNDKLGNPIMIGIVLVWRVKDTFKAAFEVDDYIKFVEIQSESAIRKLASRYAYDNFDEEQKEI